MKHIIGKLDEIAKYADLHPRFAKAFEFLSRGIGALAELPAGKHPIDGEDIFASVDEHQLKDPATAKCEAHSKYIDIQLPLTGPETFGLCETPSAALDGAFKEKDIVFFDAPCEYVTLVPGEFAIFFPPYDGHAPGIEKEKGKGKSEKGVGVGVGEGEGVHRKIIVKVKA